MRCCDLRWECPAGAKAETGRGRMHRPKSPMVGSSPGRILHVEASRDVASLHGQGHLAATAVVWGGSDSSHCFYDAWSWVHMANRSLPGPRVDVSATGDVGQKARRRD